MVVIPRDAQQLRATGSASVLQEIERENLFLSPLDLSRNWYRYHQLFSELLQAELCRTEPGLVQTLHHRAAKWFAAEGFVDEAVHHLAAAGEIMECADLVSRAWVGESNKSRLLTVSAWLDLLPADSVLADPRLGAARAWIAFNFGQLDAAAAWMKAIEEALLPDTPDYDAIVAQVGVMRAVYQFKTGDLRGALESARHAIDRELDDAPLSPSGDYCIGAHCVATASLYFAGPRNEAESACRRTIELSETVGDHRARIYALGYLATICAEDGRLEEADRHVARVTGDHRGFDTDQFVGLMVSLATAILLDRRANTSAALDAADVAVSSARQGGGILEVAKALTVRAGILAHLGQDTAAEASRREAAALLRDRTVNTVQRDRLKTVDRPTGEAKKDHPTDTLTDKEHELLRLLDTQLSRGEIGERLYVTLNTVKSHQRSIYRKLGVDSRAAAIQRARRLGLL